MFEENYRREMQAALPSAAATDALERRMDALRRRPKRPPVREVAVVLLAVNMLERRDFLTDASRARRVRK